MIGAISSLGAALVPSPVWALSALIGLGALIFAIARLAPATIVLLSPLLVLRLTEYGSGVAIESGAYMVETATSGAPSGAFANRLLLDTLLLVAAALPIEHGWRRLTPVVRAALGGAGWRVQLLQYALAALLAIITLMLALLGVRHGIPLLDGQDRFAFLARLEGTPYRAIMMNRPVIAPLIGVLLAVPGHRRAGLLLLGWLLLLSILFGEKFTSLLLILGGAAIAPLLASLAAERALAVRPIIIALLAFAAISFPAMLVAYGVLDHPRRAFERLGERAAVQGQLWYLAHGEPGRGLDVPAIGADIASWFDPGGQRAQQAGKRFGLYYVMARFTPTHRLKQAERGGTGFVFALHPYLLLAGGLPLLLLGGLAVALAHGVALALLVAALAQRRWLAALAFARLVNSAYACLFTGYLWNMFGVKSLATLGIGLLLMATPAIRSIRTKPTWINNPPKRV